MGTRTLRKFFTITLPAAKYGLISAAMVVFTYAISDFGVPKVIGGNFNVLATDIFKLVIGQQDFAKGAVVSIMLLVPVFITYIVDMLVQRRQMAQLTARSVPYAPKPARGFDFAMAAFCWLVAALMLAVLGMAVWASFIKLWPYDLLVQPQSLPHGARRGRHLRRLRQQHQDGAVVRDRRHRFRFRVRLPARKNARPRLVAAAAAHVRRAADGRAGPRAGTRIHFLLQPPGQPAQRHLPHDGDPRDLDHRPLLFLEPPDGADTR